MQTEKKLRSAVKTVRDRIREDHAQKTAAELRAQPLAKSPDHYRQHPSGIECHVIAGAFSFHSGEAIKYIWRSGKKTPDPIPDLRKAIRSIELEIARLQSAPSVSDPSP